MIQIVTALLHEAKPIIDFYHLKSCESKPYQIYSNENIFLIISDVGKTNSAAATIFLHRYSGKKKNSAWLNIGVGGHSEKKLGEGVLAHKVTDQRSRRSWYPPRIFDINYPSESVLTVEETEINYPENFVYDMEAAGFCEAASPFSTLELIQCFKIISDNKTSSTQKVSAALIQNLVTQNLRLIDSLARELAKLSDELSSLETKPKELDQFLEQRHFTVTESYQLRRQLSRLEILTPQKNWLAKVSRFSSAREILKHFEDTINAVPVDL